MLVNDLHRPLEAIPYLQKLLKVVQGSLHSKTCALAFEVESLIHEMDC